MALIRYAGVFYNDVGESYIAGIYDENYGGSTETWVVEDVEISYQSDRNKPFSPIITSEATVKILVNSSAIETLIDDIIGSNEGRFSIRILRGVGLSWFGYVLSDLITIDNDKTANNYTFEIRATDALARLKTVDYNDDGTTYTGYETITDHIFNCLNKLPGLTGLFTGGFSTSYILKVVCRWNENTWTYSKTRPVFDQTRINHRAFYSLDSRNNTVYISCYDVLERICTAFGMRMILSDGSFWMIQVNEYQNSDDWAINRYQIDKTLSTDSSENVQLTLSQSTPDTTDILEITGGVYKFFPPLAKTTVRYSHLGTENLLGGETWSDSDLPTVTREDIAQNSGLGKLSFTSTLNFSLTWSGPSSANYPYLLFRFTIIVGTQYLNRTVTFDGQGGYSYDYPNGNWQSLSGTFDVVGTYYTSEGGNAVQSLNFLTAALVADGDLSFTVTFVGPYDRYTGNLVAGSVPDWEISNAKLELLYIGTFQGQHDVREYSATNDATGNSQVEVIESWLGDGPTLTSPGHLEILDGTAWSLSTDWAVGSATAFSDFSQLLANEIMRAQLAPARRKVCSFFNVDDYLQPHDCISDTDNSRLFVLVNGTWRLKSGTVTGEWFESTVGTTYSEGSVVQITNENPGGSGSSSTGTGSTVTVIDGGGAGTPTKIYMQEFTGSATDTFTITENGGTLPTNNDYILVFLNGQWTNQFSVSGSNIIMDFAIYADDYLNVVFFIT